MVKAKTLYEIIVMLVTPVDTSNEDNTIVNEDDSPVGFVKVMLLFVCSVVITYLLGQLN